MRNSANITEQEARTIQADVQQLSIVARRAVKVRVEKALKVGGAETTEANINRITDKLIVGRAEFFGFDFAKLFAFAQDESHAYFDRNVCFSALTLNKVS